MGKEIILKKLKPEDWAEYKKIRLEALEKEPTAFAMSFEEEVGRSDDLWSTKLDPSGDLLNYMIFACDGNEVIGMAGIFQNEKTKLKHISNIYGVYLRESYRGRGIGKAMLEIMINEAKKAPGVAKISLSVNTEQLPAVRSYEKAGFKNIGKVEREMKVGNKYYDEYIMEMLLPDKE
ncbi:MAG: GNAT family protein [Candidatus Berkelbacteria bacterium]